LTKSTGDDLDRTTSGRFVRNLALTLSGGALLTLLGASAAHADDVADAGTQSDGAGTAHSGDATAVGNQSGTNQTQTVTVSGNLGTIQVINQQANVSNVGASVANTGGNIAIGNSSNNTATANQTGDSNLGPATNSGTAANSSNGSAAISTGNASSIGNQSNTTINQVANGSAHGLLGGILVINQDATVTNSGVALANSGGNTANGNDSDNTAGLVQNANSDAGLAANNGKATNGSDGKATINTGNASATGNKSETNITQSATGSAGGALGGLVIIDQNAFVLNAGVAASNSGLNDAEGNTSDNTARTRQDIGSPTPPAGVIGVASNNGEASNHSDGTANVRTGAADAVGNDSVTNVKQTANSSIDGAGGGAIVSQGSNVINFGLAVANSGGNDANGNDSSNLARTRQDAPSNGGTAVGVVGNFGLASNTSDGSADVTSGGASAIGSRAQTNVTQSSESEGGSFNLLPQVNGVQNIGASFANSGLNTSEGNTSDSTSRVRQDAALPAGTTGVDVIGNFGMASNGSDGSASITTGDASAIGNSSKTTIGQTIDPTGLIIPVQVSDVVNLGVAVANSGGNSAVGNDSDNFARTRQDAEVGSGSTGTTSIVAGTLVGSNNGEASNSSDGTATIKTGAAAATGNNSDTTIDQASTGNVDGMGFIVNTQVAGVANVGLGVSNSGVNTATGNVSTNEARLRQNADIGSNNGANNTNILAGIITASNSGTASNSSDGSASVTTGAATSTGNRSATQIGQDESGDISGFGGVINTQAAGVLNAGVGIANSGGNAAVANASQNEVRARQDAAVGSDNAGDTTITAPFLTAANNGTASNSSDGSADITTGAADGTGNASSTQLDQATGGDINGMGLILGTQVAGVANVGLGVANSGLNVAVGNVSNNTDGGTRDLRQNAKVGSGNADDTSVTGLSNVTASNSGEASNNSDGSATVKTGGAQGQGNVSSTNVSQDPDSSIDGMGLVLGTQVAGVANVGVGIGNSGANAAVGNAAGQVNLLGGPVGNDVDLLQNADVASDNTGGTPTFTALGPITASNSGSASNSSDGTAKVVTGGALGTGNASATNVTQRQSGNVSGMGFVAPTQVAGVANVGLGVANSGLNLAAANLSNNDATATQNAELVSDNATPVSPLTVLGSASAVNSGEATNSSDGEACVCTGNAVASGNVSSTSLIQDLDTSTGSGFVVITEAGGVVNAGLGLANSGLNLSLGNISQNTATATQNSTINDGLLPLAPIALAQTAHNGGGATNSSAGTGLVASGNATGTGNQSTTNFAQAADVDSDLAVSTIAGGTTNAGLGLANAGLNLGVGNASTNDATLIQNADGAGIVSNDGTASNDSDGTAIIGNPEDCGDTPTTPGTTPKPGVEGLPRTGGPLEVEAAIALMLLLVGFGLRRKGQSLA
jgi:hypothetical protein